MSSRIGSFANEYFRPGLMTALVKVAMISTWRGRTFLDDDLDLADVADFVPAEMPAPVAISSPAPTVVDASHAVAA